VKAENKKGPPFGEPFLILRMVRHQESNYALSACFISFLLCDICIAISKVTFIDALSGSDIEEF
jgi:hypothetical protein